MTTMEYNDTIDLLQLRLELRDLAIHRFVLAGSGEAIVKFFDRSFLEGTKIC